MLKDLNWIGNMVPEAWYDVFYEDEKRGEIRLSFDFIRISPPLMLAETNVVMGDATVDNHHGDESSREDSAPWKDWARFLVCGAAKVSVAALI